MSLEQDPANQQATNEHDILPPTVVEAAEHLALGVLAVGGAALDVGTRAFEETYEDSDRLARAMVKFLNGQARHASNAAFDMIDEVVDK